MHRHKSLVQAISGGKIMKKPEARIEPYTHPAAGWGALKYVAINLLKEKVTGGDYRMLFKQNQPTASTARVARGRTASMRRPSSSAKTASRPWRPRRPASA
jgi:hypothetical protein